MSINKLKVQILESIQGLDQVQSKQVLDYIRRVMQTRQGNEDYLNFKQRAMQEIQIALNNNQDTQAV
jgi:hypothetical protein